MSEPKGEFHTIITKVYDSDGDCIAITSSIVPGKYEPDEITLKYWAWLDAWRNKREGE